MTDSLQPAPAEPANIIPWGEPASAHPPQPGHPRPPTRSEQLRAAALLEAGKLVGLPTETVYGVAARADRPEALERLRQLKSREPAEALTWHIGKLEDLARIDPTWRVSPMARRLAERYWPGPLTLVLPGVPQGLEGAARDGWIGVRLPAQTATANLLASVPFPVVATSANRRGERPLDDAAAIARLFAGEVDLVLDGGPPRINEPSLVLKVGPRHFDVLRPGLIDLARLREAAGLRILFVCTGNTCRSPMAAVLAQRALARRLEVPDRRIADFGFEVSSAGVAAEPGGRIARNAQSVLEEQGGDFGRLAQQHRTRPAVPEDLMRADRVYALTAAHLEVLRAMLPPSRAAHLELLDPYGRDIPDPIGSDREEYFACMERIGEAVERRLDEWA